MTMVYDYLEGPLPPGWLDVKTVWFVVDLGFGCLVDADGVAG